MGAVLQNPRCKKNANAKEKGFNANISYECCFLKKSQILEEKGREERGYKTIRLTQCKRET